MTVTKNENQQMNVFAKEPPMYISNEDMTRYEQQPYAERSEIMNSRFAMIGVVSGVISYIITGKFFFGVF